MREVILLKLGETALKGLNRRSFEEIMMVSSIVRINLL